MQSDYMVLSGFIDRPLLFTIHSNLVWHIIMSMPFDLCLDLRNEERHRRIALFIVIFRFALGFTTSDLSLIFDLQNLMTFIAERD